jgi:hypothetical protein
VRDLSERLTEIQHELGELVRSTMHVHLSHDYCLEVLVMRGNSNDLQAIADRILATRGVKHGGIEIVTGLLDKTEHAHPPAPRRKPRARSVAHDHRNRKVPPNACAREPDDLHAAQLKSDTPPPRATLPRRDRSLRVLANARRSRDLARRRRSPVRRFVRSLLRAQRRDTTRARSQAGAPVR